MVKEIRLAALAFAAITAACDGAGQSDDELLGTTIEDRLIGSHPGIAADEVRTQGLDRYARFYSHAPGDFIWGLYLFANDGYDPPMGKAGQSYWVSPDSMPEVYDGGCSIISIAYHKVTETLVSVACNPDA